MKVKVRAWSEADLPALIEVQKAAWPEYPDDEQYELRQFELQLAAFPEGQLLAETGGRVIGYATSLIVQLADDVERYTYDEITGSGTFSTHAPGGDTLYGSDIAVHPEFRGKRVAAKLYEARRKLLRRYNLRRMVAFGRIPGYREHAPHFTAKEYVEKVRAGELTDSALTAHLRAGYVVRELRFDLMRDAASMNWATLLEYTNPSFDADRRRIAVSPLRRVARKARVCAAQWRMSSTMDEDGFYRTCEFFADTAREYGCHLLLLPELFVAQLLPSIAPKMHPHAAFRHLALKRPALLEFFSKLAQDNGVYIIAGSFPRLHEGVMFNTAHLLSPSGAVYEQDKIHVTPAETELWGISVGQSGLKVFDGPFGRFAIQVCYDIEFPETSRMLALAGAEVIYCPFSTDDEQGYYRVRYSAHARAVENTIYVALAGNAGNLPAASYLINYARSCIVTPSDYGFPPRGIAAEADAHEETVAIADLDFSLLAQTRSHGSVRPMQHRRPDLYEIVLHRPIDRVLLE